MRTAAIALLACLAACGQPQTEAPEDARAGSSGVGHVAGQTMAIEPEALIGVWSFDRTCGSGDGMRLNADRSASFDEWGQGTWSFDSDDNRIQLTLSVSEMGVGPTGETLTYDLDLAAPVADDLIGQLARSDGSEPRGINALRCGE